MGPLEPRGRNGADSNSRPSRRLSVRWPALALHAFAVTIAGLAVAALAGCARPAESQTTATAAAKAPRTVTVARPTTSGESTLLLPANIDACQTTLLHSRVNGYLLTWKADIGDMVKEGDVLAEIDTPELDQELAQAEANLTQARVDLESSHAELVEAEAAVHQAKADIAKATANRDYARAAHQRDTQLHAQRAIPDQDLDASRRDADARQAELDAAEAMHKTREATVATRKAQIRSHEAKVNSLQANVERLKQLQNFKIIKAPFDGIVVRRLAEIGQLVTAGSGATSHELFALAKADSLRIRINVPQSQARAIQVGQEAEVLVPEYPDRTFTAKVARTARAIEAASRTLMVEFDLRNGDYAVLPGTFGQVRLTVPRTESAFVVPTSVLLHRTTGPEVAVVEGQNAVKLRKVRLGRDFGNRIEVLVGLKGDEDLIVNPPDDLAENDLVAITEPAAKPS